MSLAGIFHQQFGVVTRSQAIEYGLTENQIDYRVKKGTWLVEHPGIYRPAVVSPSWESDLIGATLRTGGLASHRCAAALWGLEVFDEPPVELTIPEGKSPRSTIERLHRTRQWELREESLRRGIRCTGIERTILDCAGVVGFRTLERLAESAIRQRHASWLDLADCLSTHSRKGRNGCGKLRVLLEHRLGTPAVPLSDFSRRIVHLLRSANLPTPVIEHVVRDRDGQHLLQLDLAWPRLRRAWELDGLQWHFGREDVERDRRKRNAVIAEGWVIQEILWSMYIDDPSGLVEMARKFLGTDPNPRARRQ